MPRLVLVAAPAGFGKTTLLAQWLVGRRRHAGSAAVAWLALDAGDADLRRFLTHLVAAIQTAEPGGRVSTRSPCWTAGGATPTEDVLVSLVNDLDIARRSHRGGARRLPRHRRARRPRGGDVPAGQPASAGHAGDDHSGRPAAPAVPSACARRARRRCGPRTCRFTTDEAEVFLNEVMGLELEPALVAALEARTEGWAAGLQLAALSARTHAGAPATDPETSPGSSRPSPEATGSSSTTSSRRFWTGSRTTCARSCSTPPCSTS